MREYGLFDLRYLIGVVGPLPQLLFGVVFGDVEVLAGDGVDDEFQLLVGVGVLGVVDAAVALLARLVAVVAA
jgi:hypothetical protein